MATPLPCIVFGCGNNQGATMLYGVVDGARRPCGIDALRSHRNWVTSLGWVLAWDPATSATFLWNPQAPEDGRTTLPQLAHPPPADSECVLSGSPADPGGFTVVVVDPPESTVLWYCHAGGPLLP